jgi:hypothetical protein
VIPLEDYKMAGENSSYYGYDQGKPHGASYRQYRPVFPSYRVVPRQPPVSQPFLEATVDLLRKLAYRPKETDLADRVFGGPLRRGEADIENLRGLIYERGRMLDRNVREIDERRNEVMNSRSFARRAYSGRTLQEIARLDKLLFELESERRKEYLEFWRDLSRAREGLLESAGEYHAAKDRALLLGGREEPYV